jgi:hypothetical protein
VIPHEWIEPGRILLLSAALYLIFRGIDGVRRWK